MHLDHLVEVQDQTPPTTLGLQTPLSEAEALSPEELLQFFPRWMGEHDVSTRLALFVAWMRSESDDKFNAWIKEKIGLRQFHLRGLVKVGMEALWACLTYNIQQWIRLVWRPRLA